MVKLLPRLLGILLGIIGDALDERVLQPLRNRPRPPLQILLVPRGVALVPVLLRQLQQPLGGVVATVQHHVLDRLAQLLVYVVVDAELAGVHDAHREAGVYGVVEEDSMDSLAHRVVAPKRERDVRDAARGLGVGEGLMNLAHGLDEVNAVVVVFVDAGGDGEDVRVEDYVFGREADLFGENLVGARTDLDLPLLGVRLALLVEGHHDHGGAVVLQELRLADERLLTLLHADGVDDRLALHALQARLDDGPLGGVDHDRHARDVRLGGDKVEEVDHRLLAVEHPLVHVDVDDLGAIIHLLARHLQGGIVIVV